MFRKMWIMIPPEVREKMAEDLAKKLLVKHVGNPDEVAEAYISLMKYVTHFVRLKRLELTFHV